MTTPYRTAPERQPCRRCRWDTVTGIAMLLYVAALTATVFLTYGAVSAVAIALLAGVTDGVWIGTPVEELIINKIKHKDCEHDNSE